MILILGAGFIGSALATHLMAKGERVRLFSRGAQGIAVNEYVQGVLRDIKSYPNLLAGVDTVVHCIHTSVPATSDLDIASEIEENLLPTIRLMDQMKAHAVPALVYISTGGAMYGALDRNATEADAPRPISAYGLTKLAIENYARLYHLRGAMRRLTILRPSNIYGPGQSVTKPQGVIGHMLRALRTGATFSMWGDGTAVKDYLHVSDLSEAISNCIAVSREGSFTLNVSSGRGHTVCELLEWLTNDSGHSVAVDRKPRHPGDVEHIVLDHSKLTAHTGWTPRIGLREGVRRLVEESDLRARHEG